MPRYQSVSFARIESMIIERLKSPGRMRVYQSRNADEYRGAERMPGNELMLAEELMRMRGLEPPQDCSHSVLSAARLPFRHIRNIQSKQKYTTDRVRKVSISVRGFLHC